LKFLFRNHLNWQITQISVLMTRTLIFSSKWLSCVHCLKFLKQNIFSLLRFLLKIGNNSSNKNSLKNEMAFQWTCNFFCFILQSSFFLKKTIATFGLFSHLVNLNLLSEFSPKVSWKKEKIKKIDNAIIVDD
jgi:hypothetical protein